MQIARLLRSSSKSWLLIPSISLLFISFLIGTGETRISSANTSAAGEFADTWLPFGIGHLNVTQSSSQASNTLAHVEAEDYKAKDVSLTAGQHEPRFAIDTGYFNFNHLDVVTGSSTPLPIVIRVLPLGDSITSGNSKRRTYRYPLWVKLIDSGFNFDGIHFDLVGSKNSNHSGQLVWPDYKAHSFDRDHEGHSGWRAEQILALLPTWLKDYTPDIVLLHLGTNDVMANQTTLSTINEIGQIIDVLRADNPKVIVLLAKIIPAIDPVLNQRIIELNQQIDRLAMSKSTIESPVVIVDQNLGFNVTEDTNDGVHPNRIGEEKMAQKWFEAIAQAVHLRYLR